MSFRNQKDERLRWQKWVLQHHDELLACGVPQMLLENMGDWCYFLEHGYFTPSGSAKPIIDVDHMSTNEAQRLCLFLERDEFYPRSDALNRLQYILKRGKHSNPSVRDS